MKGGENNVCENGGGWGAGLTVGLVESAGHSSRICPTSSDSVIIFRRTTRTWHKQTNVPPVQDTLQISHGQPTHLNVLGSFESNAGRW